MTLGVSSLARRHRQHERRIARVVARFFTGQTRRIVTALRRQGTITAAAVPLVFRAAQEHAAFMKMIRRPLATVLVSEAKAERRRLASLRKRRKADDTFAAALSGQLGGLPDDLADVLKEFLDDLEEQPYWAAIQAASQRRLTDVITGGVKAGDSDKQIAKRIADAMGGAATKQRALAIARTEVTGMLNAAHHAVHQELAAAGLLTGKTWNATLDGHARATHHALHGVTVKVGESFIVGGHAAPFPGHWSLPPAEKCNCRCVTITQSVFDDPAMANAEDEPGLVAALAVTGTQLT